MLSDINQHRTVLTRLLRDYLTDGFFEDNLGFKGGTSLYLLENLPRFSTDLDFNLLMEDPPSDQLQERLIDIASSYGTIRDQKQKHYTHFVALSYEEQERNIKVEINRPGQRNYSIDHEIRNWRNLSFFVEVLPDQAANKMVAVTDRNKLAGRDIFDTAFMMKNDWSVNEEIIQARTECSLVEYLEEKLLPVVQSITPQKIMNDIGELVQDHPSARSWVQDDLLDELEFMILEKIDQNNTPNWNPTPGGG